MRPTTSALPTLGRRTLLKAAALGALAVPLSASLAACDRGAGQAEQADQASEGGTEAANGEGPATSNPLAGPHAAEDRAPAALLREAGTTPGTTVREADLGNIELGPDQGEGAYRAPVRGLLVTPDSAGPTAPAPLVVIGHLRSFNCSDETFAYPVPEGVTEIRYDRGMRYLGEALAAKGWAVLIPDLAPVMIGESFTAPYDQTTGWVSTVTQLRDSVIAASAGTTTAWGEGLDGAVDASRTAVITHSRSASVMTALVEAWKGSAAPVASLMSYGGFYQTPDGPEDPFGPMTPADVPLLAVDGDADSDTNMAGVVWLTEHVCTERSAPAVSLRVPKYGHYYVNRELSSRGFDDRAGLDEDATAPTAAEHEALLSSLCASWLAQTVLGQEGPVPVTVGAALPETVVPEVRGGVAARWLVASHGPRTAWVASTSTADALTGPSNGHGGQVTTCRTYMSMDPTQYPDRCAAPEVGVATLSSFAAQVGLSQDGGATLALAGTGATHLALHLTPEGSRSDSADYTALSVLVRTADGGEHPVEVSTATSGPIALRDLASDTENGDYTVATVTVPLPAEVTAGQVSSVELRGDAAGGTVLLRAAALLGAH